MPEKLTYHQMRALRSLQNAGGYFEPLGKRKGIRKPMADQLVDLGLAEWGECHPKDWTPDDPIGIRLTDLGHQALARGWV